MFVQSGVGIFGQPKISEGGTFIFVQIWCRNFLAEIFLGQSKISEGGNFMFVQMWCWNFLAKIFFSQPKILEGGTFIFLQKWQNFFPTMGGTKYENFRMSWNIQICKNFWPRSILCWPFGPQSSGWANFGCHFDPVTPIAQGPDFYWSFRFCPSLPVPNLVLISWMMWEPQSLKVGILFNFGAHQPLENHFYPLWLKHNGGSFGKIDPLNE